MRASCRSLSHILSAGPHLCVSSQIEAGRLHRLQRLDLRRKLPDHQSTVTHACKQFLKMCTQTLWRLSDITVEQRPHLCLVAELHCGINVGHRLVLRNDWLPDGLQLCGITGVRTVATSGCGALLCQLQSMHHVLNELAALMHDTCMSAPANRVCAAVALPRYSACSCTDPYPTNMSAVMSSARPGNLAYMQNHNSIST